MSDWTDLYDTTMNVTRTVYEKGLLGGADDGVPSQFLVDVACTYQQNVGKYENVHDRDSGTIAGKLFCDWASIVDDGRSCISPHDRIELANGRRLIVVSVENVFSEVARIRCKETTA